MEQNNRNSLLNELLTAFPTKQAEILRLFEEDRQRGEGYQETRTSAQQESSEVQSNTNLVAPGIYTVGPLEQKFPHFGQLHDYLKCLLGPTEFLKFIEYYTVKNQENNKLIKEEFQRNEKEALTLEAREQEKFFSLGLQPPKPLQVSASNTEASDPQFCYSSLSKDMSEEFREAKWVVLTSPFIQTKAALKGQMTRESSVPGSASGSGNFTIQLSNLGQNSNRSQASTNQAQSNQAAAAASLARAANQPPQKRYGHSACLVKNKMYVFGGLASQQKGGNYQTFYECNLRFTSGASDETGSASGLSNMLFTWDKIKGDAPRARDSHTIIHAGDTLIMFGGSGGQSSFNDLQKFDLKAQRWSKLDPYGDLPAPREGHISKLIHRDKMLIHGGVDQNETSFNDTYILTGVGQYIDSSQISSINAPSFPTTFDLKPSPLSEPQGYPEMKIEENYSSSLSGQDINSLGAQYKIAEPYGSQQKQSGDFIPKVSSTVKAAGPPDRLRWYKCIDRGPVPQGRDSHSCAFINNKLYIFGGQGDGDIIFDDLYSLEIIEERNSKGHSQFIAQWTLIEKQTPKNAIKSVNKPRARTSHSCTAYKNRYMIIIGGEGEFTDDELMKLYPKQMKKAANTTGKRNNDTSQNEIEIELESSSESIQDQECVKKSSEGDSPDKDNEEAKENNKRPLNDVWVYDTLTNQWCEIKPGFRIQGSLLGKKIKKDFEPRMAHSAVALNQFVIVFGGLSLDKQLVSNDLYILSLDGNLGAIQQAIEPEPSVSSSQLQPTRSINIPQQSNTALETTPQSSHYERSQSFSTPIVIPNTQQQPMIQGSTRQNGKSQKGLRVTNPEDRRVMNGHILNQIINYNNGVTQQYYFSGNAMPSNFIASASNNGQTLQTQASQGSDLFSQQLPVLKSDRDVQTLDNVLSNTSSQHHYISDLKQLDNKQQVQIILKQNDYRLQTFQRTKYQFIKSMADQITWPLQCFGGFIDNSIEAYDLAKQRFENQKQPNQQLTVAVVQNSFSVQQGQRFSKPLDIDINLVQSENLNNVVHNENEKADFTPTGYIEIKDNGPGIHPKQLMEALTSFGNQSNTIKNKSDYSFSEHGIGLKLNSLRLAQSTLIISKTKPVVDCGTATQFLTFGLLSTEFLKKADAGNGFLIAPIVAYEYKLGRINKKLTPEPEHFLNMIVQFSKPKFTSGDQLRQYGLNAIPEQGGTHIFLFNLQKHKPVKNGPEYQELGLNTENGDIVLNPSMHPEVMPDQPQEDGGMLETSLKRYLQYLYIEYPPWVNIKVNGQEINKMNPYSVLKRIHPTAFQGEKADKYAIQYLDEKALQADLNKIIPQIQAQPQIKQENALNESNGNDGQEEAKSVDASMQLQLQERIKDSLDNLKKLQGVLIYRGNRLIRRLENVFGDDDACIIGTSFKQNASDGVQFKHNAIVSVFKSRSSSTLDKKDLQDKLIIKKIKQWFKQIDCANSNM